MARFVLKRLGLALLTLFIVSIGVFSVANLLPGDVGRTVLGPYATNTQVARYDRALGLDHPLLQRYFVWLGHFLTGNWGTSAVLGEAVRPLVLSRYGHSLELGLFALIVIAPISIALGVLAAYRQGRLADRIISVTGLSLVALPEFVGGVILLVVFGVELSWLPVSSAVPSNIGQVFPQFILPALALGFVLFGYIARMARAGTIEALASGYVRTAVLKGIPQRRVLARHVLRNSLLPTVTVVAVQAGYLIGGLVVVEDLFNYPGIGFLIFETASRHDLPVLEASVLLIAVTYVVLNLAADILIMVLNPRLRASEQ